MELEERKKKLNQVTKILELIPDDSLGNFVMIHFVFCERHSNVVAKNTTSECSRLAKME